MRADLQTMEQIDLYLQGKMTAAESAVFENSMAHNPELAQLVANQQLLAQTVSRKALLAEINLVAGGGGGAWYANPYVGLAGATIVIGIVAATIYYTTNDDTVELAQQNLTTEQLDENNTNILTEEVLPLNATDSSIAIYHDLHHTNSDRNNEKVIDVVDPVKETDEFPDGFQTSGTIQPNGNSDNHTSTTTTTVLGTKTMNKAACFPKGYKAMRTYVTEEMIYPGTAKKEKIQANVKVEFLVGKEGQISEIVANCFRLRDENEKELSATQMMMNSKIVKLFEDKCTATLRTMPSWEPATDSQGNTVVSVVTVYFNFSLHEGISIYQLDN